ncbi:MAG: DUF4058 family protein [Planctomycetaceae bacterium]
MPLLDHFRPPLSQRGSWEGFHGMWPALIVQQLNDLLPHRYHAEPRVHLGTAFEIDVCTFEPNRRGGEVAEAGEFGTVSTSAAAWAPPEPTLAVEVDPTELYEYEVLILDDDRDRDLVAAVEIASPGNQDRPETRRAFVAKCAALLQKKVCVSIVDLVTTMHFNLYCELLDIFGQEDPAFNAKSPATYAVTCRSRNLGERSRFETWAYPMIVGQPLPVLPLWLSDQLAVSLDLESAYQETCRALRLIA